MGIPGEPSIGVRPFPWDNRFGLTGRELEVLRIAANGLRNPEIADTLKLSGRTVERHLESVFLKMGVNNRVKAIVLAFNEGLIDGR
jgi:DNA-binding CsgD family transcriptional regulator